MTKQTILCLCTRGGAKSVIAAAYFNRLAEEGQLPYVAVAAAAEEPYASVPEPVAELLQRDGFDVHGFEPRRVEADALHSAAKVISIECEVSALDVPPSVVEQWNDVPNVSDDLDGSAAAIRRHVDMLAEELRGRR